ncbi:hypothetical protein LEP1GSC082_3277 [Leptospira kirschneri str. H2]|nr:hypothetical protein LEP1GSC082_3277 [Leptospira kirschneri str. H2]
MLNFIEINKILEFPTRSGGSSHKNCSIERFIVFSILLLT